MVVSKKLLLHPAFVWEAETEELIKKYIKGYTLNCPCGMSLLGDVRIDIVKEANATLLADFNNIPLPTNSFDTVISDPPWHLDYFKRFKQFYELVRVCKVGGTIIFNALWIPDSKAVKLEEIFVRKSSYFGNFSGIMIFTKITDEFDKVKKE